MCRAIPEAPSLCAYSALFEEVLRITVEIHGIVVHSFVLLPDSYRLVVESPHGNLSRAMQCLNQRVAQAINRRVGRFGHLWAGRFKSRVVESESEWLHLLPHVHNTPVRAQLVRRAQDWPVSSHPCYMDETKAPSWLTTEAYRRAFGTIDALLEFVECPPKDPSFPRRWPRRTDPPPLRRPLLAGRGYGSDPPLHPGEERCSKTA